MSPLQIAIDHARGLAVSASATDYHGDVADVLEEICQLLKPYATPESPPSRREIVEGIFNQLENASDDPEL